MARLTRPRVRLLAAVLMFAGTTPGIVIGFMYPDKTRTRLFLDYWWLWLGQIVWIIGFSIIVNLLTPQSVSSSPNSQHQQKGKQ